MKRDYKGERIPRKPKADSFCSHNRIPGYFVHQCMDALETFRKFRFCYYYYFSHFAPLLLPFHCIYFSLFSVVLMGMFQ